MAWMLRRLVKKAKLAATIPLIAFLLSLCMESAPPPRVQGQSISNLGSSDSGNLLLQTAEVALRKSTGCIQCHKNTHDPHDTPTLRLGCIDCHCGNPDSVVKGQAHVLPRFPDAWKSAANPVRSYT